ncbi:MAG: TadE family protein [Chloroflexi bacterium]|nr:MAG: TadE family protein [Chloroflexota bacterium]
MIFKINKHISYKYIPGQALVEIAILLPILLLLIIGAMDFGRLFITKIVLTNAAREGVNYLSTNPTDKAAGYSATISLIQAEAQNQGITIAAGDIIFSGCCSQGNAVEVKISKNAKLALGNVLQRMGLTGGPIKITSAVQMVVQ